MNMVKRKRLDLEITQKELGQKIGVTPVSVGRYERSEAMPCAQVLIKMCDVFNCTPQEIIADIQKNAPQSV